MNNSWIRFKKDGVQYSPTEELGLSLITDKHKNILSVGISTAGFAEVRMALDSSERKITATTLDEKGLEFTKKLVEKYSVENQVSLKIEDISSNLLYENESFDFVYARLVLHYLEREKLEKSLKNIYNILSSKGEMFVVVRSYDWESEIGGSTYDLKTGFTTYPNLDSSNNVVKRSTRHLHSVGSISSFLQEAGFTIKSVDLFSETIFHDYERKLERKNRVPASLIAIHLIKE